MIIPSQYRSSTVGKTRNAKKVSGSGAEYQPVADEDVAAVNVAAPLSPMQPVAAIDSLLVIQEIAQKKKQTIAVNRSHEMLTLLTEIRVGLLGGHIPEQKVQNLSKLANEERQSFEDNGLNEILEEVDLRAKVELAKMKY